MAICTRLLVTTLADWLAFRSFSRLDPEPIAGSWKVGSRMRCFRWMPSQAAWPPSDFAAARGASKTESRMGYPGKGSYSAEKLLNCLLAMGGCISVTIVSNDKAANVAGAGCQQPTAQLVHRCQPCDPPSRKASCRGKIRCSSLSNPPPPFLPFVAGLPGNIQLRRESLVTGLNPVRVHAFCVVGPVFS